MDTDQKNLNISINTGSVVRAALALALLYVLFLLRDLVLVLLVAVVIASAVAPATRWFVKRRVPRILAVLIVYFVIALLLFSVFYFLVPPLLSEASAFLRTIPEFVNTLDIFGSVPTPSEANIDVVSGLAGSLSFGQLISSFSNYLTSIPGGVFSTVSAVFGGAFSFVLIVVISFYLSVQERGIENFLGIVTPRKKQKYVIDLWRRSQSKIGRWMQGQLLLMLIVTVLVFLGLTILGVEHAFLFALLAGLFELIPLFGPVLASVPAIAIGFIDGGLTFALIIAGIYIVIQQFENHLIYPLVVHKVVGVPALLVILALIIGGQLAGFLGIILAVPITAALMELTSDIEKRNREEQVSGDVQ